MIPGQTHGIFTLSATQLQNQGMIIPKYLLIPVSLQVVILLKNLLKGRLKNPIKVLQFPES